MNSVMASAANAADKPCSIEGAICNFINKIAKAFRINSNQRIAVFTILSSHSDQ